MLSVSHLEWITVNLIDATYPYKDAKDAVLVAISSKSPNPEFGLCLNSAPPGWDARRMRFIALHEVSIPTSLGC
jgi:hypothetical protein